MLGNARRLSLLFGATALVAALPAQAYVVTNLNDAGPGSFRQAVIDANGNAGSDVITFHPTVAGAIHLTSGEIAITDSVDIQGPGARVLAVGSSARIFNISGGNGVNVTISGLTLSGAQASGNGGAITNSGANVTLRFVTVAGNSATGEGGAIYHNANGGTFTVESSTISGNSANKAGAIYSIGYNLVIRNSTVSGNHATDSVGGIKLEYAYATIANSTVVGNSAGFSQGGVLAGSGSYQLDLVSTILAANTDVLGASDLVRFSGTVNASACLVAQSLAAGVINGTNTGNLIGVDPMLGPLAFNGGPTQTHALLSGSPAIDVGSNPYALTEDQRGPGFARSTGGGPDIGAFEFGSTSAIPTLSAFGAGVLIAILLMVAALLLRRPRFGWQG